MSRKGNVWLFVVIAFGFSWLFWIPNALIAQGLVEAPEGLAAYLDGPLNPGPWGPLFASVIVTLIYEGAGGLKNLFKRCLSVRLGKWWLVALLIFPVLIGGSLLLAVVSGEPVPYFQALEQPLTLPIAAVFIFFLGGPLQEELGWRGYAFEHLRFRYSALTAAIISGLMWGLWHLPLFFVPRAEYYYNKPVWGLLLTTVLVGIIIAWIYINTKSSIFAAMVAHTMFNWSNYVFPALGSDSAALLLFGLYGLVVIYIVKTYGRETMVLEA